MGTVPGHRAGKGRRRDACPLRDSAVPAWWGLWHRSSAGPLPGPIVRRLDTASGPGLRRDSDPAAGPPRPLPTNIDSSALGSLPAVSDQPPCPRPFLSSMAQRSPHPQPRSAAPGSRDGPRPPCFGDSHLPPGRWGEASPAPGFSRAAPGLSLGHGPSGGRSSPQRPLPRRAVRLKPRPFPWAASLLPWAGPARGRGRDRKGPGGPGGTGGAGRGPLEGLAPSPGPSAPVLRRRSHGPGLVRFRQYLMTMRPPHPGSRWGQHARPRWRRAARRPSGTRPKCARASCARCAWRISRRSGSSRPTTRSSTRAKTGTSGRSSEVRVAAVNVFSSAVGNPCSYFECSQISDSNKILIEGTYRRGMQFHSSVNFLGPSIVFTFSWYFP